MMWSWVQPGLLYVLKCHLFHDPSRLGDCCADARERKKSFTVVSDLIQCACLVANLYTHGWKSHWKFRFHCTCTDQFSHSKLQGEKWVCYTRLHCLCIWPCTGRGQSAEDVTVTSHYESISKLPSRYSFCNVTSNCSTLPDYEGWIVLFVCSHALYTWPSTSMHFWTCDLLFFQLSALYRLNSVLFIGSE